MAYQEIKIKTEVKEMRTSFYCELCNKQYKLDVEFEGHLSSYDHNHRKMKEMHGSSSCDKLIQKQLKRRCYRNRKNQVRLRKCNI
nr:G patch domain-containing protein 8 [Tanacetum cinerariifolium]